MKFNQDDLQFKYIYCTNKLNVFKCLNKEIAKIDIPVHIKHYGIKYTITGIGDETFYNCENLQKINIPNTIKKIGNAAFYNCTNLKFIKLPNHVTYIGVYAFYYCINLENIILPNSITEIGVCTFENCYKLKNINLPNSLIEIGVSAFAYCENLQKINLPNSVTYIGNSAFAYCKNLKSITLPNSIKKIENYAFYGINIKLPKSYTENNKLIAYKAFNLIDSKLYCRDFEYTEGETYTTEGKIKCRKNGFHACTNPLDVFNYRYGEIGRDIDIHEVFLGGEIDEDNEEDSQVCASEITIGRKLSIEDINNLINQ